MRQKRFSIGEHFCHGILVKIMTYVNKPATALSRRTFVTGVGSALALAGGGKSLATSFNTTVPQQLSGDYFELGIGYQAVNFTGYQRVATAVNGSVPAPILRWREGDRVRLKVTNHLSETTSIHWHGMILPSAMDGVPGLSFAGIAPGASFEYEFDIQQNGTYWYHSHSGFQEQTGLYGAIVIDSKQREPFNYERDYVVLLSDWSDENPEDIYANLKKMSHYYNARERTAVDVWTELRSQGIEKTWNRRSMWNQMRMSDRDIADVTGSTYTFLMNGVTPDHGWQGIFKAGETLRLRFINGSAMTIFDVRIPGLKMTVVAADGQHVQPVNVDEFRIGTAETYDVIVEPEHGAYTIFAQTMDRTGYARGNLTSEAGVQAAIPTMDPAPVLSHRDMGMTHDDHAKHQSVAQGHHHHHKKLGLAGDGSHQPIVHKAEEFGAHVDMRSQSPASGLQDPGVGLRDHLQRYGRKVLTYGDLKNRYPSQDRRQPQREIQLHLTGNMSRYMWSFDGVKFADAEPINLKYGERLRITLVNDTMMTHPIHLHGLWSELETGDADYLPRKHTVLVQPGSKISYLVTADSRGRWAYHCHLMFHMAGMMREVRVS